MNKLNVLRFGTTLLLSFGLWCLQHGMTGGPLWFTLWALFIMFIVTDLYWSSQVRQFIEINREWGKEWGKDSEKILDYAREVNDEYEKLARQYISYTMKVNDYPEGAIAIQTETDHQVIEKLVAEGQARMEARLEAILRETGTPRKGRRPNTTGCTEKEFHDAVKEVYEQCVKEGKRPTWPMVADKLRIGVRTIERYRQRWSIDWPSRE